MNEDHEILDRMESCLMGSMLAIVLLAGLIVCLFAQSVELKGRIEILERMVVK